MPRSTGARLPSTILLPCLAVASVAASLLVRIVLRGPYYPGWDVVGPAQGQYLLSTQPFWQALGQLLGAVRHFGYWNPTHSLVYTLVPGALGRLWPWEYWGHALTLLLVLLSFWLVLRFSGLPLGWAWLLALAWGASPALLSYALAGYPYATGFLPHALALVIVTWERVRRNWLSSLVLCLAAVELSWHVYEPGKTLIVVLLAAALLERPVPPATRAAWVGASALQVWLIWAHRGSNLEVVLGGSYRLRDFASGAANLFDALLVDPRLDLSVLPLLGVAALCYVKRHRFLVVAGLASQVALLLLLAARGPEFLFPRRYLTTACYCVVAVALAVRESLERPGSGRLLRRGLLAGLVAGNLWQIGDQAAFFRRPYRENGPPLPYTAAPDYTVRPSSTRFARHIAAEVRRGQHVLLVYGFRVPSESIMDPAAVLERLYLDLGHDRFVRSVHVFSSKGCRYDCLPIRPLRELRPFLDALAEGRGTLRPEDVAVYYKLEPGSGQYVEERTAILAQIERRLELKPDPGAPPGFARLKLTLRPPAPLAKRGSVAKRARRTQELALGHAGSSGTPDGHG